MVSFFLFQGKYGRKIVLENIHCTAHTWFALVDVLLHCSYLYFKNQGLCVYEVKTGLRGFQHAGLGGQDRPVGLLYTKERRWLGAPPGSVLRGTHVTRFLPKVAGESQVCMQLWPSQPRLCRDPRTGLGRDACRACRAHAWVDQELHLGSELKRQRDLSHI